MIVLDASVLKAQLSPADVHHGAATQALLAVVDEDLVVHRITLAELLVGGVRLGRGSRMRADIEDAGVRLVPPADGEPLRLAELRVRTGRKLPDCCVLETALVHNAALMTFDKALAAAAGELGIALHPPHADVQPTIGPVPAKVATGSATPSTALDRLVSRSPAGTPAEAVALIAAVREDLEPPT